MYKEEHFIELPANIKKSLLQLFYIFTHEDKELYLVGGCVRDLLLGKNPKDYDLCTNATPEEIKKILDNKKYKEWFTNSKGIAYTELVNQYQFIDTGLKHGTVTIHDTLHNLFYEITTYRVDGKYLDNRHPKEVTFTPSLEEDLKRRDFTINSFAYHLLTNELVMLDKSFLDDLQYGVIRTVGRSTDRFEEDALRILRAFRFAAQLGFIIDTDTYEATKECGHYLAHISKERIRDELTKILLSDNPRFLEFILSAGLEKYLFDGHEYITDMLKTPHENPYHYTDVFHHTLDVIERVPAIFELRWAALFHDIGKPLVKQPRPKGPEGHYVYYGHADKSIIIARSLMDTLKFSNKQKEKILTYIKYHDEDLANCKISTFKKALIDIDVDNFLEFMKLKEADSSAHCLSLSTKYAVNDINKCYCRYKEVINNSKTALKVTDLDITGDDLIALGLKGKQIGEILQLLLEKVLENPNYNEKKKLIAIVNSIK